MHWVITSEVTLGRYLVDFLTELCRSFNTHCSSFISGIRLTPSKDGVLVTNIISVRSTEDTEEKWAQGVTNLCVHNILEKSFEHLGPTANSRKNQGIQHATILWHLLSLAQIVSHLEFKNEGVGTQPTIVGNCNYCQPQLHWKRWTVGTALECNVAFHDGARDVLHSIYGICLHHQGLRDLWNWPLQKILPDHSARAQLTNIRISQHEASESATKSRWNPNSLTCIGVPDNNTRLKHGREARACNCHPSPNIRNRQMQTVTVTKHLMLCRS